MESVLVHTGQHYDPSLSQIFFEELALPEPDHHLGIGSGSHGAQTGAMLEAIEAVFMARSRGIAVVYGDTNSTLVGALAAVKLGWKLVHVEAGLRSFDRSMPEELNRIATDHVSDLLLCPTVKAMDQLKVEGLHDRGRLTGDVMLDVALESRRRARTETALGKFLAGQSADMPPAFEGLSSKEACRGGYALATVHRAANTDDPDRLRQIVETLDTLPFPVILPLHPRTRVAMDRDGLEPSGSLRTIEPVGYLDFAALIDGCGHVLTDSGGVQKEALFAERPCTTMRAETEWTETLDGGWNVLVDADAEQLRAAATRQSPTTPAPTRAFGDGRAGAAVVEAIASLVP
jgi:UDP-N-acetylglucosamine 2-epimerase